MTARHASKIVDAEVDCYIKGDVYIAEVNLLDVPVALATVSVSHWSQESAIRDLILECYRVRCRFIAKQQRYRCAQCDCLPSGGLQAHHKVFRSHSRCDKVSNIEMCCPDCHSRSHGIKVK